MSPWEFSACQQLADRLRCVPGLPKKYKLANGSLCELQTVQGIKIEIMGRNCVVDAAVIPEGRNLLGAIPLEDIDLHVDPAGQRLIVNPESPDMPSGMLAAA